MTDKPACELTPCTLLLDEAILIVLYWQKVFRYSKFLLNMPTITANCILC